MDVFPELKILVAHAGGALPYLVGRLDSCVAHDNIARNKLKHAPSYYLTRLYYDAISHQGPSVGLLRSLYSADRLMFGYLFSLM